MHVSPLNETFAFALRNQFQTRQNAVVNSSRWWQVFCQVVHANAVSVDDSLWSIVRKPTYDIGNHCHRHSCIVSCQRCIRPPRRQLRSWNTFAWDRRPAGANRPRCCRSRDSATSPAGWMRWRRRRSSRSSNTATGWSAPTAPRRCRCRSSWHSSQPKNTSTLVSRSTILTTSTGDRWRVCCCPFSWNLLHARRYKTLQSLFDVIFWQSIIDATYVERWTRDHAAVE